METVIHTIVSWVTNFGLKAVIAVFLLLVSFKLVNVLAKKLATYLAAKAVDKTLSKVLLYTAKLALKGLIVLCLLGYIGVETTAFSALIASLGVGVGLAMNGALSNMAGGLLILVTRPFRIDDFIEACGVSGTVEDIHIVTTKVRTVDNKVAYLPNGALSSGSVINYTEKKTRRVDHVFSIAYSEDFSRAQAIVWDICTHHPLILQEDITVRMIAHSASSIDIATRVWVNTPDYWTVYFDLLEQVKAAFDREHIEIPFEQVDVHIRDK